MTHLQYWQGLSPESGHPPGKDPLDGLSYKSSVSVYPKCLVKMNKVNQIKGVHVAPFLFSKIVSLSERTI